MDTLLKALSRTSEERFFILKVHQPIANLINLVDNLLPHYKPSCRPAELGAHGGGKRTPLFPATTRYGGCISPTGVSMGAPLVHCPDKYGAPMVHL